MKRPTLSSEPQQNKAQMGVKRTSRDLILFSTKFRAPPLSASLSAGERGGYKSYQVDSFSCRVHPGVRIHFMQSSTVSEHALQSICTQVTGACWGSSSLTALGPRSAPDLPDPARLASLAPSSCGWPWAWAPCLCLSAPPALAATLC